MIVYLRIDCVCFSFVAIKPYDGKLSLHLAWIYFHYSYPCSNQLFPHGICETPYGRFRCAVNRAAWVWFPACYRPNVDDVPSTSILTLLVYRKDSLSHVDEACNVGGEHDIDVFIRYVWSLCCASDETTK